MKNIPKKLFLVIGDEEPKPKDFNEFDLEFVCWSPNRTHKSDIAYTKSGEPKNEWVNAKDTLNRPPANTRVLRYDSVVNSSQERMAVHVTDSNTLKYADESTYWMLIPELPVPLKTN